MAKKKTVAKLVDDAAVLLQKIRRIEEADSHGYCVCVTCGVYNHWKQMHGGHFLPRNHTYHKLNRKNINPQCVACNTYKSEAAKIPYTLWMQKTHGEVYVKNMVATRQIVKKYPRAEILQIIATLKLELKELESSVN